MRLLRFASSWGARALVSIWAMPDVTNHDPGFDCRTEKSILLMASVDISGRPLDGYEIGVRCGVTLYSQQVAFDVIPTEPVSTNSK